RSPGSRGRAAGGAAARAPVARRAAGAAAPCDRAGVLRRAHPDRDRGRAAGAVGDGQDAHARRHGKAARLAGSAALERRTMTDHQGYRELAAPFALDALTVAERAAFEAMRARLDSADRLVGAILDSTVGTADLAATGKAPTMRLYWNRARGLVVVAAFDLPPAPAGRTYQLWAIKKGQAPVSVGTFNTLPGGRAVITLRM